MFVCEITLSSSLTVWVCFLWKAPLAGLKPEHFRLFSADSSDWSVGSMLSSFPMQAHDGTSEHVSYLQNCEKWKFQIACYQIANIYLENKTSCRQLLISSVIMGNGTDQWLKCQIKMAFVLCCMKISNTHCVWERSECFRVC